MYSAYTVYSIYSHTAELKANWLTCSLLQLNLSFSCYGHEMYVFVSNCTNYLCIASCLSEDNTRGCFRCIFMHVSMILLYIWCLHVCMFFWDIFSVDWLLVYNVFTHVYPVVDAHVYRHMYGSLTALQ